MQAFPRLKSRGPIEADLYETIMMAGNLFPRLKSRGPIEASQTPDGVAVENITFPRLKSRGPIEA